MYNGNLSGLDPYLKQSEMDFLKMSHFSAKEGVSSQPKIDRLMSIKA